jgi:predicted DsbA family dithiol-disulfide isomerase
MRAPRHQGLGLGGTQPSQTGPGREAFDKPMAVARGFQKRLQVVQQRRTHGNAARRLLRSQSVFAAWLQRDPRAFDQAAQTLAQTAEARNLHTEFNRTVQPFMHEIQQDGVTPLKAVENLMNTAAWLRRGNPAQKAQVVASIIKTYGIDISALDEVLASGQYDSTVYPQGQGQVRQPSYDPAIISAIEQKFAPTMQFVQSLQERMQQSEQQKVQEMTSASEQFLNDPANEFAWDVKDDMADLIEYAAKRGQQMSLQEAYRRATMLHPDISKILEGRRPVQEPLSPAAIRAKQAASVSPANSGAPIGGNEEDDQSGDLRSDLRSSIRKVTSSR